MKATKFTAYKEATQVENEAIESRLKDTEDKLKIVVDQVEDDSERVTELENFTSSIYEDQQFLHGVIQRQDKLITKLTE